MNASSSNTDSPVVEMPEHTATEVLVVDRNQEVCAAVSTLINAQEGFHVCGVANEAKSGLEAFRKLKPEIVITGIAMPGMNGLKMTQLMLAEEPKTRVLIHSVREEVPTGLKALRAGAKGFVRKGVRPSILVNAMRHVALQGLYLSPKIKEKLVSHAIGSEERQTTSPLQWLNPREQTVFQLLGKGMSSSEIAAKMGASSAAVDAYRARIKEKLGLPDAHALIACALQWEAQNRDAGAMMTASRMFWRG